MFYTTETTVLARATLRYVGLNPAISVNVSGMTLNFDF